MFIKQQIIGLTLLVYATNGATQTPTWQVSNLADGKGAIATQTVFLPQTKEPSWASLIVEFNTSRRCSAVISVLFYTRRDLGKQIQSKRNPDTGVNINVDGVRWKKSADAIVQYEHGFEVGFAPDQTILDAIAYGMETQVLLNNPTVGFAFETKRGVEYINQAADRCANVLR
jgi:hypothetical protein